MIKTKLYRLALLALCLFFLTACEDSGTQAVYESPPAVSPENAPEEAPLPSSDDTASPPAEAATPAALSAALSDLWWGRIDGSTATIPLTAALHDFFDGAGSPPTHETTHFAYNALFQYAADLIFVTYPSENEWAQARDLGVEMEITPIAKDALVFLVNAENPVDGVSLDQLRDIYTGKITNWKALGGADGAIVPYQRPPDSGSQTLLTKLVMGGRAPMRPPAEWLAETMGSLVEVVSGYDNAREAVGYSMFYYVNNMYGNDRFKLLGIDGTKPSRDTITRGAYPLEDHYYAVIRKDTPAHSPARKLVAWLLTEDGQRVAAKAGYIPLRPLTNVSPDGAIDPVYLGDVAHSSGTGGTQPKPAGETEDLVENNIRIPLSDLFYDGFNYIAHINGEIVRYMNSAESSYRYDDDFLDASPLAENVKRPFTGIPNNYQNHSLVSSGESGLYLRVFLPKNNPFFDGDISFDIRLTSDISPYGIGTDDVSVRYDYAGRPLPNVALYTLSVRMPQAPHIAARINEQLAAWSGGVLRDGEKAALINSFIEQFGWPDDRVYTYHLQPVYGRRGRCLSVSYPLQTYDGPLRDVPVLDTICFDVTTGEIIDLAARLPGDLPYANSTVFDPIPTYETAMPPSVVVFADYIPAKGSVITSAWFWGQMFGLYMTEPDGRKLQVSFYAWDVDFRAWIP
jgi:phosphate transport system substrate-binding protein